MSLHPCNCDDCRVCDERHAEEAANQKYWNERLAHLSEESKRAFMTMIGRPDGDLSKTPPPPPRPEIKDPASFAHGYNAGYADGYAAGQKNPIGTCTQEAWAAAEKKLST